MRYRELERAGLKFSEIGLGCEGFVKKTKEETLEILKRAKEEGINCIDMYAPDPELRSRIGWALQELGGGFAVEGHLCAVWKDGQYKRTRKLDEVKEGFEDMLTQLGRDSIEVGMIHYVDALEDWETVKKNGILDYARGLKAAGKIQALGLSSHNPQVALEAVKSGDIDVLLFSVNPCYDLQPASEDVNALWDEKNYENQLVNMDPEREELYEVCQRMGVGITVMKAFGGGDLLDASLSPAGTALTVLQCLHYALTRPGVVSIMSGVHSVQELLANTAYETATEEEKDYAPAFASMPKISWEGHCMYCGHCAPCPKGIDVAAVTKFLNLVKAQKEMPETVREHYGVLPHKASECVQCKACEKRCPFHVKVTENMREAAEIFGA